ncbi:MAG: hypothetical protein JST27_04935 [Bacteroidetes bacterium]|nr:hypothetical protein [Bacteroidota bacterium]
MQFAIDADGKRVQPTSGARALCEICGGTMIAACGEVYIDHWRHDGFNPHCDTWYESETWWHRQWKEHFPKEWREVVIEKWGQKHRADVQVPSGLVIEFQNSAISQSIIRTREHFYGEMIWVINAKDIDSHFKLRSIVNRDVRDIQLSHDFAIKKISEELKKKVAEIEASVINARRAYEQEERKLVSRKKDAEYLTEKIRKASEDVRDFLSHWKSDKYYFDLFSKSYTKISKHKEHYISLIKAHLQLQNDIAQANERLGSIEAHEAISIEGKKMRIVPYGAITKENFDRARAIVKETYRTFFPEVKTFKSFDEVLVYKHRQDKYVFVIDPERTIILITQKLAEGRDKLGKLAAEIAETELLIESDYRESLGDELLSVQGDIAYSEVALEDLAGDVAIAEYDTPNLIAEQQKIAAQLIKKEERVFANKRFGAMREGKGLYTFDWKYERKSWQAAEATLYFDVGKDFLWERVRDGLFRKLPINEFVSTHLGPL